MSSQQNATLDWGSTYRLVAADKWRAKSAAMGRDVTEALVNYARPEPGMSILDLAAGTGEPAISLASKVGAGGHVTALDLSADLLQIAARRARERNLTNFSTQQADAHQLPFLDNSFDLITCRFGIMFFDIRALREAYRVLKPKTRACFLAWGPFDQPFWSTMLGVAHKYAGGARTVAGQDPCRFGQPGSLAAFLREAGFENVEEKTEALPWTWPGEPEEIWEQVQASATPFLPMLQRIPVEKRAQVDREVMRAVRKYQDAEGIKFGATVVFGSGQKA